MRHVEERSRRPREQAMLIDWIRVPGHAQSGHQGPSLTDLEGVHRVHVEVAEGDALFLRDRKACRRRGCSAVGELREIVVDHVGHNPFAKIVVAHVEPAGVLAELEAVASMRPDQVVVDLPLGDFAALRVGLVVAAKRGEGRVGTASGQHDGKGLEHLRVVVGQKEAGIPARAGVELIDQIRREESACSRAPACAAAAGSTS